MYYVYAFYKCPRDLYVEEIRVLQVYCAIEVSTPMKSLCLACRLRRIPAGRHYRVLSGGVRKDAICISEIGLAYGILHPTSRCESYRFAIGTSKLNAMQELAQLSEELLMMLREKLLVTLVEAWVHAWITIGGFKLCTPDFLHYLRTAEPPSRVHFDSKRIFSSDVAPTCFQSPT
jgi:hypothetical protein